ncbi:MAG TPA: hypothetical protein VER96_24560 [Polyangiaceae bacterium]|nr:hypothetical protein [Polyangiaceae bacterium]
MREVIGLALLILSCSSGSGSSRVSDGPGSGGWGAGNNGNLGVDSGQRDCSTATDKQGCYCPTLGQQRQCQVGTCPGAQSCLQTGSGEFAFQWGTCELAPHTASSCSTTDGSPGSPGSSGGAGNTADGQGGKGSTHDGGPPGGGGKGNTHDGQGGGKGNTHDGQGGKGNTFDGSGGEYPSLCSDPAINNEPEILVAHSPANGETVSEDGQIKVWINDEGAPFISPNETLDPDTGAVLTPGDRAAQAPDGYLWEPALYIAPATAESGGTPHFPQMVKGWYNYPGRGKANGFGGAAIEPIPGNPQLHDKYNAEDIWDVSSLGLPPGNYIGEFVIWDGDTDRAVGCINIVITP